MEGKNNVIDETIKSYQHLFGLDNWTIEIVKAPQDVELANAKTLADPRYNRAVMTLYPRLLTDKPRWESIIIHELIHIVMAWYDYFADNLGKEEKMVDELFFIARENSVSQLTSIIMRIKK